MEENEGSSPTRGRGGNISTRRGSPPRSQQQQTNRLSYNNWASHRGRAVSNSSQQSGDATNPSIRNQRQRGNTNPSIRNQRQRGNRRVVVHELDSPEGNGTISNSSSETGLNRIRQMLDDIDASIPDDSVISIENDSLESNSGTQAAATASFNNPPQTYSSIHGSRRFRRRPPFNGGTPHRGASNGPRNHNVNTPDRANSVQQISSPRISTGTSEWRHDGSMASRRQMNIPPPLFGRSNLMVRELSSDSSDDQSISEPSAFRPHIQPVRANSNLFVQGLGTEEEPFELSAETPEGPNAPSQFLTPGESANAPSQFFTPGESVNRGNHAGNGSGGAGNSRRRRAGRGRFGNARQHRFSGSGAGGEGNSSRGAAFASSPSPVLPPPGTLTDEELAQRLQEEEWDAAAGGIEHHLMQSMDSLFHQSGAGYHRRTPAFGLHLPPLPSMDDGNYDSGSPSSAPRQEDGNPFFFDGGPRPNRYRAMHGGHRPHRYLSPLHQQLSLFSQLMGRLPQGDPIIDLLNNLVGPDEMESLIGLSLDAANGADYEALLALSERIGDVNRGLSEVEINNLPTRKHKTASASRNGE
ncbi:hypothetical protein EGW08_011819 [Elysia chlorotica]|uniref:Uncharacterized protein n=1 Tax=Elysia chlorotica TaxID=188477 RepID=A0A3S1BGW0_ELYCH|nr:hypothetical protein EGW08_011819 [Elysia chlorotica]